MAVLQSRILKKILKGDLNAYEFLMKYGRDLPDQVLKEEETKARIQAIQNSGKANAISSKEGNSDVVIYLPELEPEEKEVKE